MASFVIATGIRNDVAGAVNNDVDAGKLQIYSGASPGPNNSATGTLLAELTLPAKTSNSVSNGVLTFGTIASENAVADGTAGYFRLLKADGTTVVADGDIGTTSASLNLNTTSIVDGGPVNVTAFAITMPAGT